MPEHPPTGLDTGAESVVRHVGPAVPLPGAEPDGPIELFANFESETKRHFLSFADDAADMMKRSMDEFKRTVQNTMHGGTYFGKKFPRLIEHHGYGMFY